MFHRTQLELPRTNKSIAGWYMSFQGSISDSHSTIWKFLALKKHDEGLNCLFILQRLDGQDSYPLRRRYVNAKNRIVRIVDNYPNIDTLQYLHSIALNLGF